MLSSMRSLSGRGVLLWGWLVWRTSVVGGKRHTDTGGAGGVPRRTRGVCVFTDRATQDCCESELIIHYDRNIQPARCPRIWCRPTGSIAGCGAIPALGLGWCMDCNMQVVGDRRTFSLCRRGQQDPGCTVEAQGVARGAAVEGGCAGCQWLKAQACQVNARLA